ncbi:MAG TPA: hypothetical protein ENN88_02840 [Candidatus Coatesbacteria bacterium]|nr:hypothetical protein [Candidatus Coatesbacteria bacterium]
MTGVYLIYGLVDALRRRRLLLAYLVGLGACLVMALGLAGRLFEAPVGQQLILLTRNLQSLAYFPLSLLLGLFFGVDAAGEAVRPRWAYFGATRTSGRLAYLLGRLLAAPALALATLLLLALTAGITLWAATGSFYALILDAALLLLPGIVFTTTLGYLLRLHASPVFTVSVGFAVIALCFGLPFLWEPLSLVLPALLPLFDNHTALADFHAVSGYPFALVQLVGYSSVLAFFAFLRLGKLWFDDPLGG